MTLLLAELDRVDTHFKNGRLEICSRSKRFLPPASMFWTA